jgi:N-ethylmaleimide reductase
MPVSIRGNGYAGAPGIYSDSQIAGWHRVTDAVHAKGGRIFLQTTFGHVVTELDRLGIAYLHVVEPRIKGIEEIAKGQDPIAARHLRPKFSRTLIAAGAFTGESAEAIIAAGNADLVAFGRYFISNPDLPERLRRKLPLTRYDRSTFYGGDGRGYIDYPVCAELALAAG